MSGTGVGALFYGLLLLLPLSALLARRIPLGRLSLMVLAWVGIFGVGLALVAVFGGDTALSHGARRLFVGAQQEVVGGEVRVPMAADGHFYVQARINNVTRTMLVDSGASVSALSVDTARAAGLDVDESALGMLLETANGTIEARRVTIRSLRVGDLAAHDIVGAVSPAFGAADVLGMNFLSRLRDWRVEGGTLILGTTSQ